MLYIKHVLEYLASYQFYVKAIKSDYSGKTYKFAFWFKGTLLSPAKFYDTYHRQRPFIEAAQAAYTKKNQRPDDYYFSRYGR